MKQLSFILTAFFVIFAYPAQAQERTTRDDLKSVFAEFGTAGTFVLYDIGKKRLTLVNEVRAETRKIPASTFKIANSLIALETAVIDDENQLIPYGGMPQPFKSWERDMSMRKAIRVSNVPIYQELARRIGFENYGKRLKRLRYGNAEVGQDIETFWLKGPLKISAIEQARFLASLAKQKLPLSKRSQTVVRDILRLERKGSSVLFGKTGWTVTPNPQLGWFVGWVENERGIFSFALNIDMNSRRDAKKRKALAKVLLKRLAVY